MQNRRPFFRIILRSGRKNLFRVACAEFIDNSISMNKKHQVSLSARPQRTWRCIQALAFVSGGLALAQQVLWTRRMIDLLGAAAGSSARVFSCFFLGLALGAAAGGALARRTKRPWKWIGLAELGVALFCLPMVFLPQWSRELWPWLGPERLTGPVGAGLKTLLSVGLVLPPALFMGFFLPLAVAGRPRNIRTRDPGLRLYVINTLGAVAGILWVTLWLPARFGILNAMLWVIGGNVASAAVYFLLNRLPDLQPTSVPRSAKTSAAGFPPKGLLTLAAVSGAGVLSIEIIALKMVQWVAPLSFFGPGAILASFIGLLVISSALVEQGIRRSPFSDTALLLTALAAGLLLLLTPPLFRFFAPAFSDAGAPGLLVFFIRLMFFTLLVFGPAVLIAGFWFPLAAHKAAETLPDHPETAWAWMLAANGAGGLLGAEFTLQILLPLAGPFPALGILGVIYLFAAWMLLPREAPRSWSVAVGALTLTALPVSFQIFPQLPTVHPSFAPYVLDEHHGREGSVILLDSPRTGRAILLQNQYILGSSLAVPEQERQAHVPLLLHPAPRQTGFIGAGTGISPGGALRHSAVEQVTTAEISAAVLRAADQGFAKENHNLMHHPRSKVVTEDGRTWVAAHIGSFDVLISDLFLPWGPGEGRLYTLEHFHACRRALRKDGLFCLWLPLYQLTDEQTLLILRTFLEVFGEAELFLREREDQTPALGVIGGLRQVNPDTAAERLLEEPGLNDPEITPAQRLLELRLGRIRRTDFPGDVNTLDNLRLELAAGRMRATLYEEAPYLTGERLRAFLEDLPMDRTFSGAPN